MVENIRPMRIMIYFVWFIIIFHHRFYSFNLIKHFVPIISIMLYIPKIYGYLKILTDDEVKDFVYKNFGEYFKSTK